MILPGLLLCLFFSSLFSSLHSSRVISAHRPTIHKNKTHATDFLRPFVFPSVFFFFLFFVILFILFLFLFFFTSFVKTYILVLIVLQHKNRTHVTDFPRFSVILFLFVLFYFVSFTSRLISAHRLTTHKNDIHVTPIFLDALFFLCYSCYSFVFALLSSLI